MGQKPLSLDEEGQGCSVNSESRCMRRAPRAGTQLEEEETEAGGTRARQEAVGKIQEGVDGEQDEDRERRGSGETRRGDQTPDQSGLGRRRGRRSLGDRAPRAGGPPAGEGGGPGPAGRLPTAPALMSSQARPGVSSLRVPRAPRRVLPSVFVWHQPLRPSGAAL